MTGTDELNGQIRGALFQIDTTLAGADRQLVTVAAYQSVVQTVALGMQNAVAQQQQGYILRNAMTTAAAGAILDGKKEEAESILRLADSRAVSPDVAAEIAGLLAVLKTLNEELLKFNGGHTSADDPLRK